MVLVEEPVHRVGIPCLLVVTSVRVDVLAVQFDSARGTSATHDLVHAVQAANERALAAAGRPDDGRDLVGGNGQRDVLDHKNRQFQSELVKVAAHPIDQCRADLVVVLRQVERCHFRITQCIGKSRYEQVAQLIAATPLGRMGRPEEIASVVRFLLSEEASFVTGQTIVACGGRV